MIQFQQVSKVFEDGFQALKNINFEVEEGELLTLIGPSGCGKTTTMKMINRLIDPTEGEILIEGENILHKNPVQLRRDIGYVIQQIGLFPHMTIEENISIVPKLKKWPQQKYMKKVDELLDLVGLDPEIFKKRYPSELSGGQQQRIGVIRALAGDPPVILMDEPFSALDPISREQLQDELLRLQKEIKKTIVFVTHDMDEALKIANRMALMKDGEIIQLDTPSTILQYPATSFVRDFIGKERMMQAQPKELRAADLMQQDKASGNEEALPADFVRSEQSIEEVAQKFTEANVASLPVYRENKRIGQITMSSVIQSVLKLQAKGR
ncbi:ABC transporter ATP-binding protein [Bacillus horti]|uniref:Quaternary amine transport ATP-binding protein n=1 Tax=Caldalkalibacillus horti TaxID=77523 RepID=A0ABT9W4R2_9BACI|nr:ABC transporter ATP-binding protein [Bacillus horti]MDQ0167835.1 osmoprotectant transport system ATP-binding protein [Bacillus horti]